MIHNSKTIFDAHTHIHFPAYDQDRGEVIKRAQEAGVKMIAVGTNLQTSKEAVAIAEKYPNDIWATVGFHPSHVLQYPSFSHGRGKMRDIGNWYFDKNELREPIPENFNEAEFRKLAEHPKAAAIGECGLDYYRIKNDELPARQALPGEAGGPVHRSLKSEVGRIKDEQKKVFLAQARIASHLQKPLMIHCRPSKGTDDAYEDILQLFLIHNSLFLIPKIIHFFVGPLPIAKKLLEAGCYFTFGGVITFVRDYDEAIKFLPLENILLETDAPYVAPEPFRGKRNEPAYVIEVAKKMAEIKNIPYEKVVQQTTENIYKQKLAPSAS